MRALLATLLALALPALAAAEPPRVGIVTPNVPPGTSLRELGCQLYAGNCASATARRGAGVGAVGVPRAAPATSTAPGRRCAASARRAADFYLRTGYMPLGDRATTSRARSRVLFATREIRALVALRRFAGRRARRCRAPHPRARQTSRTA